MNKLERVGSSALASVDHTKISFRYHGSQIEFKFGLKEIQEGN